MLTSETATLSEVAAAIGRNETYLKRNWLKLHLEQGFPRKISVGWVWPRRQLEAWLRAGGVAPVYVAPANENAPTNVLLAMSEALSDRYGARA